MTFPGYLALTGAEFTACSPLPRRPAWMACHVSPSGKGLSSLPAGLPAGAMVILDDAVPISGHDSAAIVKALAPCVSEIPGCRVLLDFQRPDCPETVQLTRVLVQSLPCPVGVAEGYAGGLSCPVFLPPVPPDVPIAVYLRRWEGREVWLDAALDGVAITVTALGAQARPLPPGEKPEGGAPCRELCCHVLQRAEPERAVFTLYRTPEDLAALLRQAQALRVSCIVGLYQELAPWFPESL